MAAGLVASLGLTACGGGDDDESGTDGAAATPQSSAGGSSSESVVLGTTDTVTSTDPAGAYDLGSWTLIYNMYQNLMKIQPGSATPVPDAAESCDFTNPTTYTCTLKSGLKFSNGSDLTSEDVKASFDRMVAIEDDSGPSSLFANLKSTAAPDPTTVTMTLNNPDATWPFVLTTGAGAIVDSEVYPADSLLPSEQAVGSGPYKLASFQSGQQAVFEPNESYTGDVELKNNGFIVQYYTEASALKLAIEEGDVDVAYRSLAPTDIEDLRGESGQGVQVVEGNGTEIRYLTFQTDQAPSNNKAVRQAIAQLIDRQAIAEQAYDGTVTPLYSMIPQGLDYHTEAFQEKYGEPDVEKAKALLGGVSTPVDVTLWYTPTHYGPNAADEITEIQRQLEESGLFKVTIENTEWQQYQTDYKAGTYPLYQLGWFPDFPDPDNYSAPFLDGKGGYFNNGYENPRLTELIAQEQGSTDDAEREAAFAEIQEITAEDVPVLPVWQGKQIAAVRDGVTGVQDTFDPSFTFRFWLVSKQG
ncbi:ABC transporter substrate-binding protein [Motilibacter aurantiacus]|uniref:ABC transporter substrate-binding protein n=1 Tax=Motilibacter aurantiacus TaxID=2714955 RepID=UPI00140B3C5B|nr:ABC transporter substrate-binding protein [Motilibacter aurantiacus]